VHVVYVLDVSGSMEDGRKIDRVRTAMEKALSELRPDDFFNIVFFSDDAKLFSKTMRPATASNISAGISSVSVAIPTGATNLSAGLDLAFQQPGITHIFLMSDGEPTEGITDFDRLAEFARVRNQGSARIITLALGRGEKFKGMALLQQLAEEGRGKFDYVNLAR
jgi:Ca-activated chloride channel family protein